MVYDGVPVEVSRPVKGSNEFVLDIGPRGLTWIPASGDEPRYTRLGLVAQTFDEHGRELKRVAKFVKAIAPPNLPATGAVEQDIVVPIAIPPDPKAVRVRVVVREEDTEQMGSADVDLKK